MESPLFTHNSNIFKGDYSINIIGIDIFATRSRVFKPYVRILQVKYYQKQFKKKIKAL